VSSGKALIHETDVAYVDAGLHYGQAACSKRVLRWNRCLRSRSTVLV